jgi:hypothetical protein
MLQVIFKATLIFNIVLEVCPFSIRFIIHDITFIVVTVLIDYSSITVYYVMIEITLKE